MNSWKFQNISIKIIRILDIFTTVQQYGYIWGPGKKPSKWLA